MMRGIGPGSRAVLLLCAMAAPLAGCGGTVKDPEPSEDSWNQEMDSGRDTLRLGRYKLAETHYLEALRLGRLSNNVMRIGDAGYNLSVVLLRAGLPAEALATAEKTMQDVLLRNNSDYDTRPLSLVMAGALFRLQRYGEVIDRTRQAASVSPADAIARRALFIRGLAADRVAQFSLLNQTIASLSADTRKAPDDETSKADLAELQALASIGSAPVQAAKYAATSADLRKSNDDFKGMVRVLRLEADAAQASGQTGWAQALRQQAEQSEAAYNMKHDVIADVDLTGAMSVSVRSAARAADGVISQ
ncbi:hypothetical protein LOC54_06010 [Acetobacter sp. AN02]|uniref:hypothetical protein n=1 Tax=Acetobacter sp. AN02 TaxID=2894186 RepID=UPI0024345E2E|nr:hypothetical protein [Acetobacter sp. AN02]MDG6094665.1 hypothetical protein [Acetobacter sp. AN02]